MGLKEPAQIQPVFDVTGWLMLCSGLPLLRHQSFYSSFVCDNAAVPLMSHLTESWHYQVLLVITITIYVFQAGADSGVVVS